MSFISIGELVSLCVHTFVRSLLKPLRAAHEWQYCHLTSSNLLLTIDSPPPSSPPANTPPCSHQPLETFTNLRFDHQSVLTFDLTTNLYGMSPPSSSHLPHVGRHVDDKCLQGDLKGAAGVLPADSVRVFPMERYSVDVVCGGRHERDELVRRLQVRRPRVGFRVYASCCRFEGQGMGLGSRFESLGMS